jgi:phosphoglucomutase
MPSPALSFAVRYFGCDAGIVITASHNPKKYNGFKVYGSDGCQATVKSAEDIYNEILNVDIFKDVKTADFNTKLNEGSINLIFDEVFEAYMNSTLKQSVYKGDRKVNIVYTPLYGAGYRCVTTALKRDGFNNLVVVEEQIGPDGNFPTTPYPNPEMREALTMGIDKLLSTKAHILVATDPDSDRCGVVVNQNGKPVILTGNEVGILLFDFIYNARKIKGNLPNKPVLVKTIVSSDMANIMAEHYGVEVKEVLTGFKYIGEQILYLEQKNETERFLFGFEESCGYLSNPDCRDKDAVNAVLLVAEMADMYASQGLTLKDRIDELYNTFGDFKTHLLNFEFEESVYKQKINDLMSLFRSEKVKEVIPDIDHIGDYLKGKIIYTDHEVETNLPASDVMKFFLKSGETITIRPSGTEPKLKAYIFANGDENLNKLVALTKNLIEK